MIKLILNEQQVTNLVSYLNRADIKGSESPAWMDLMGAIVKQVSQPVRGGEDDGGQQVL